MRSRDQRPGRPDVVSPAAGPGGAPGQRLGMAGPVGDIAPQGHPVGDAGGVAVVVERVVEGGPVVPEGHRTGAPTEAAGQLGLLAVPVEHLENGVALVLRQPEDRLGELGVHEQPVAAVLRVGTHHRMEGGEQLLVVHPLPVVAPAGVDVGREPGIEMDGDQRVAHGPDRVGQPVVGVLQAGPRGVAAVVGALEHVEDRPEGRLLEEGDVGVPPAGPVDAPVDGQHVRVLGEGRDDRMAFGHRPELRGELGLLGGGEVLVAEEDHVMGVEGLPDLGHHRLAERLRQVDAVDLRSDDRGQRPDIEPGGDRHGILAMGSSVPHAGTRSTRHRAGRRPSATVGFRPSVRRRTVGGMV